MTEIDVTAEDIVAGVISSCSMCPVALAMTRALGRPVSVSGSSWRYVDLEVMRKMPMAAIVFIYAFDNFDNVQPFKFEVDVDDFTWKVQP